MPPRRSTTTITDPPQSSSSSSTSGLNLPLPTDILASECTPGYIKTAQSSGGHGKGKGKEKDSGGGGGMATNDTDKKMFLQELMDLNPSHFLQDLRDSGVVQVNDTLDLLKPFLESIAARIGEEQRERKEKAEMEVTNGLAKLETLLLEHGDKAFDQLQAWALKNSFDVPEGLYVTLPWHQGMDFSRAEWVANLPAGEDTVRSELERLRGQVEDMRKLKQKLQAADRKMAQKVARMEKTREEVGYVKRLTEEAGLTPLAETSSTMINGLQALHDSLSTLERKVPPPIPTHPSTAGSAPGPKEWEFGRAAYLNWATKAALNPSSTGNADGGVGAGIRKEGEPGGDAMDVDAQEDAQMKRMEALEKQSKEKEKVGLDGMREEVKAVASEETLMRMGPHI